MNGERKMSPFHGLKFGIGRIAPAVLVFGLAGFSLVNQAESRTSILNGSISLRQEYDSNIDRTRDNELSEWTTTFSPEVRLTSEAEKDKLVFSYSPGVVYNHRTDEERFDHYLDFSGNRQLSSTLGASFSETYVRAEDPYSDEESGIVLADNRGRNRYWTNRFSTGLDYLYARDSLLSVGYAHQVLDNTGQNRQDYKKHNPFLSISYSFSPQWQGGLSYAYTKGKFDQSDDLEQNDAGLTVTFLTDPHDRIFGRYGIIDTEYDGAKTDYTINSLSLGWEKDLDRQTSLSASGGVSLLSRDVGDDKESFFYELSLSREINRGSVALAADGGFDQQQFNGSATDGLSRYWAVRGDLRYQLLKDLDANFLLKYREDDQLERIPEEEEKFYEGGAGLTYGFSKFYALSLRYVFTRRDAENASNDYHDNRVYLELRGAADLFRWN